MKLYYYPLSTYSQKVLLAFYEKQATFSPVVLYPGDPADRAALAKLTPIGKVPLLVLDNGWKVPESTTIIEYLDTHASGPRLIPADPDLARQTRFHDRLADLYINEPYRVIVRESDAADRVAKARERLDAMFAGLDNHLANRTWVMGDTFTLADCALVPTLMQHGNAHPFTRFKHVNAYFDRAMERPSVVRVRREQEAFVAKSAS
jgi:glutathione S-transferase